MVSRHFMPRLRSLPGFVNVSGHKSRTAKDAKDAKAFYKDAICLFSAKIDVWNAIRVKCATHSGSMSCVLPFSIYIRPHRGRIFIETTVSSDFPTPKGVEHGVVHLFFDMSPNRMPLPVTQQPSPTRHEVPQNYGTLQHQTSKIKHQKSIGRDPRASCLEGRRRRRRVRSTDR
jgi:hypothetical protein